LVSLMHKWAIYYTQKVTV